MVSPGLPGAPARHLRALARRARQPRFLLGQLVLDPYGEIGAIDAVYLDIQTAINNQVVDDSWFAAQQLRPKTPKRGHWYSVLLNHGAALCGEDDLRPAPAPSRPLTTRKTAPSAPAKKRRTS